MNRIVRLFYPQIQHVSQKFLWFTMSFQQGSHWTPASISLSAMKMDAAEKVGNFLSHLDRVWVKRRGK